jgi:hypothetical protein
VLSPAVWKNASLPEIKVFALEVSQYRLAAWADGMDPDAIIATSVARVLSLDFMTVFRVRKHWFDRDAGVPQAHACPKGCILAMTRESAIPRRGDFRWARHRQTGNAERIIHPWGFPETNAATA